MIFKGIIKSFKSPNYSFSIYFGVPGSGKTTFAAWMAKRILKHNGHVWSNVPIKGAYKVEPKEDIGKYLMQNGTLLIDEAGIEYNNRDYKKFSQESTYFYKFHRLYKMNVCIFSQGFDDMDKKLRTLATHLYVCKKSVLPFLIRRYQISKRVGINDITKDICDEYYKVPFSSKWIFSPSLWTMFDSFSTKPLPEKDWSLW